MARNIPAIHDEDGGMTIYGLYVFVICAMMGGLAQNVGEKVVHGSGGMSPLRAAQ